MIIALASILTVWVSAAGILAFADGSHRTDLAVATALSSTEQIRANQAAWDEFEQTKHAVAA